MVATRRQAATPSGPIDISGDESDWEEESIRKVKRVKRSHKATRKPNTRNLASILTMPLEIQLEFLSWLAPKDLISISRTTKEFCQMLTTRSATGIWKLARENEGVPGPPPAMSELQWAVLLFGGNRCENCGTPGVHTIDFGIRRRVCTACKKQNLVVTLKFRKEYTEYDEVLLDMIPYTNIGGWARGQRSGAKFYWLDDIIDMSKQWATLQDAIYRREPGARQKATEFYEARKDLVQAITTGVRDYEVWDNGVKNAQQMEIHRKRENRRDEIRKRLQELGYLQTDIGQILWSSEVIQSKELTDRIWNRIRPILEVKVQDSRKDRISWERKLIFQEVFSDYVKTLSPKEWPHHPSINDVLELPGVSSVINDEWDVTVTKENLEALVPQIPEWISVWQQERKEELRGKVLDLRHGLEVHVLSSQNPRSQRAGRRARASEKASSPDVDVLDLATSIFVCKRQHCPTQTFSRGRSYANIWFGWPGVLLHSCRDVWTPSRNTNDDSQMSFEISEKGYRLAVEFVRMAGLDPKTATIEDMDKAGHKYFCTVCGLRKELIHAWRDAVAHGLSPTHDSTPAKWRKLTDAELLRVRCLSQPKHRDRVWGCGHCAIIFNVWELRWKVEHHLSDSHLIENPVEGEDIIFFAGRRLYQPSNEEYRPHCRKCYYRHSNSDWTCDCVVSSVH